ncbi:MULTISPECIES: DUF2510 domain-containing protein [Microbacterium]|uniref:DUF2510 domain-containing protein n=1 Tax=Microbacterium TaxID=33882 RepID=UPI0027D84B60|nr:MULTISPECIES: DUF2510 domain-containing protein [Microbacterium]
MTDSTTPTAPAGWFPAGVDGQERYWDGAEWTDQVRPVVTDPAHTGHEVVPQTAPASEKKARNVLGIVALAVAAVGFIFACIPGALIVGWILLPISFILGIVALFQKDKPKWQGVTAIIVSVVGTIVGAAVFIAVVAGAFSDAVDSTVTGEIGSSDVVEEGSTGEAPSTAQEPAAAAQDLVVGETAFGMDTESGVGWYAVQLTNPNEDYVYGNAGIDVEAYDANGVLIDTGTDYSTILTGTSWYVGTFFNVGSAQIDRIEVRGPTSDAATYSPTYETGTFTVGEVTTGSEFDWLTVNGTLTSKFSEDQDMVRVDLLARDGGGKIVGVNFTYTDRVPAGGTVAWNVPLWSVPLDSTVEAYPHL